MKNHYTNLFLAIALRLASVLVHRSVMVPYGNGYIYIIFVKGCMMTFYTLLEKQSNGTDQQGKCTTA